MASPNPPDAPELHAAAFAAGSESPDHASLRRHVQRYARALGATADEADDLTQETMLRLLDGRATAVQGDAGAFLRGVARNLWLQSRRWWLRRREREIAAAVDELWLESAEHDGGEELVDRLRTCLERLQPRARRALELHYRDGLAWSEVAAQTELNANGIKTLAQRSRKALRDCIERRTA
ncbi:MAG: RNA polymerase sigma factor [Planctomycetota bacterium]